jgi:putative transposase
MTTPLSQDLRRRISRAVEKGSSIRQAAARYEVSPSAAVKLMQRVRRTGSLAPDRAGGHRRPVLEPHEDLLRNLVAAKSSITLAEIRAELKARGIVVAALHHPAHPAPAWPVAQKKDTPGGRAGPAGCSPRAPALACVAALHG